MAGEHHDLPIPPRHQLPPGRRIKEEAFPMVGQHRNLTVSHNLARTGDRWNQSGTTMALRGRLMAQQAEHHSEDPTCLQRLRFDQLQINAVHLNQTQSKRTLI